MPTLPSVGTRFTYSGQLGTVRFVGEVQGATGIWIGVEWDDPNRGKHDGVKGDKRYFTCVIPNAGSFIRPSPAISYGTSFLEALYSKYIEIPHGSGMEKVILGSSNGAIEVEAVGLDKIRGKLSNVERLREVSLDNEQVASSDPRGKINETCPGIRGLDLSKNLFVSWDIITLIVQELPLLERLALNQNRLQMPSEPLAFRNAFASLRELQINAVLVTWTEIRVLTNYMPKLQIIETGYNQLQRLVADDSRLPADITINSALEVINLDSNELTEWAQTCEAIGSYTSLQRVILSSNNLAAIDTISNASSSPLRHLKHLALASNSLKCWLDIDRIPLWCPELVSLTLSGNPLLEDQELGKNARQLTIAKIPTLLVLDAAVVSPKERADCELFYLSYISKHGPEDEEAKLLHHPRWKELCDKYGKPYIPSGVRKKRDTLNNQLLSITILRCTQPPVINSPGLIPVGAEKMPLRVLPSMSMRAFRLKVAKSFKVPKTEQGTMKLWLNMPDGILVELDNPEDIHDLSWWGLDDGSELVMFT